MRFRQLIARSVYLIAAFLIGVCPNTTIASSSAGIEIELGKFKLNVYYSVVVNYDHEADRSIRDPRLALFTLAAALQANRDVFSAIDHTVYVELYRRTDVAGNFLEVTEDPQTRANVLRDGPVGQDIVKEILTTVCHKYADACKRPPQQEVDLYRCQEESCLGQIRFGSFPSDTVNKSFGLLQPRGVGAKPISVTQKEIRRYFKELE